MSILTFTLRKRPDQRVDMSPLVHNKLAGMPVEEIRTLTLRLGKRRVEVDELFDVHGDPGDRFIIRNSSNKLDYIGREQESGAITVEGDAGAYLGMRMKGGKITVIGSAGIFAACEMQDGDLEIKGNAGDFLGGALPGNKQGMKGGTVLVKGNVGQRAGDHMRRGIILVEGSAGDYCGSRMTAGTIAVMGDTGRYLGYAMKRGTLLLWKQPNVPPTFNDCGSHTLTFLSLFFASMRNSDSKFSDPVAVFNRVRRYGGDMSSSGRGEILVKIG
ncbi:MAG: formylmethanofuran dehydrogenase subunit C [Methylococcaceae bacterium]|nr:formylmethanofuran dehydrogenase subunit C [Methylococcaceae bacterium]MCI0734295.1 formylmethanofuran dehydrogenase subunit C [Methylococcaceae bacterium]